MNGMDISKFNDEKMSRIRRQNIGFVFQFYNLIPNLNVAENIMLPLLLDGKKMRDYKKPLKDILEVVGLSDKRGHPPPRIVRGTTATCGNRPRTNWKSRNPVCRRTDGKP